MEIISEEQFRMIAAPMISDIGVNQGRSESRFQRRRKIKTIGEIAQPRKKYGVNRMSAVLKRRNAKIALRLNCKAKQTNEQKKIKIRGFKRLSNNIADCPPRKTLLTL